MCEHICGGKLDLNSTTILQRRRRTSDTRTRIQTIQCEVECTSPQTRQWWRLRSDVNAVWHLRHCVAYLSGMKSFLSWCFASASGSYANASRAVNQRPNRTEPNTLNTVTLNTVLLCTVLICAYNHRDERLLPRRLVVLVTACTRDKKHSLYCTVQCCKNKPLRDCWMLCVGQKLTWREREGPSVLCERPANAAPAVAFPGAPQSVRPKHNRKSK